MSSAVRVVAIADLHGFLPQDLTAGDVLVIAGDVCPISDHDTGFQDRWLRETFYPWLDGLPHDEVVWIAGNHDFVCQLPEWRPGGRGRYLLDSSFEVKGLVFHGTPWVPKLEGWAFYAPDDELERRMASVPGADVLVSHGPPHGYGDTVVRGERAGSAALLAAIDRTRPRVCVFGHIHEDHGAWERNGTRLANVAHVDVRYGVRPNAERAFDLAPR